MWSYKIINLCCSPHRFCSLSQDSELIYVVHADLSVGTHHHNRSDNTSYFHHRHPPVVPVWSHLSSPTFQCGRRRLIPCLCFYVLFCFQVCSRASLSTTMLASSQLPSLTANLSLAFQNSLYIHLVHFLYYPYYEAWVLSYLHEIIV